VNDCKRTYPTQTSGSERRSKSSFEMLPETFSARLCGAPTFHFFPLEHLINLGPEATFCATDASVC